jgi:hypothetical protein
VILSHVATISRERWFAAAIKGNIFPNSIGVEVRYLVQAGGDLLSKIFHSFSKFVY